MPPFPFSKRTDRTFDYDSSFSRKDALFADIFQFEALHSRDAFSLTELEERHFWPNNTNGNESYLGCNIFYPHLKERERERERETKVDSLSSLTGFGVIIYL